MDISEAKARYNAIWDEAEERERLIKEGKVEEHNMSAEEFERAVFADIEEIFGRQD